MKFYIKIIDEQYPQPIKHQWCSQQQQHNWKCLLPTSVDRQQQSSISARASNLTTALSFQVGLYVLYEWGKNTGCIICMRFPAKGEGMKII